MCSTHSAAGERPWPGWLGKYTLKLLARRSWNGSHRPAPPAPCRNRRAGPLPSWSIWIGVPRIDSSRGAGISADEETAVRRQPLPGEERAVVAGEEERRGGDLPRVAGAPERRAEERPVEVHGEHPPPRLVGEILGDVEVGLGALSAHHLHDARFGLPADSRAVVAGTRGDARVVDEDIERAELALDGREHRHDLGAVRHVGLDRAAGRRPLQLRHRLLGHLEAHVVDDDARALLGEEQRDRAPEPRSPTRPQRDTVSELHRSSLAITVRPPHAGAPHLTLGRRVYEVKTAGTRDAEILRLRRRGQALRNR